MGSKSSSKSSSSTQNYDNRAASEAGSVLVNAGSTLEMINEFPDEVKGIVVDILQFAGDVGKGALDVTNRSIDTVTKVNESLGERLTTIEQGGADKMIGSAVLAVIAVVAIFAFKRF